MRHLTHAQLVIAGAVTVTVLAIATGAAAADGIRPDDRAMHGPGAVAVAAAQDDVMVRPDDRAMHGPGAVAVAAAQDDVMVRPDDRAMHGPGAVVVVQDGIVARPGDPGTIPYLSHGTGVDQSLFHGEPAATQPAQLAQAVTIARFDWADAGVGALATLGLVLLAAGAAIVALRRRPELA